MFDKLQLSYRTGCSERIGHASGTVFRKLGFVLVWYADGHKEGQRIQKIPS